MGEQESPARRLRTPSWLDVRLVLGLLLVLVAVVAGARVVSGADKSTEVWGMAHDVAAGTKLTGGDLREVRVRLYEEAERYVDVGQSPIGLVVNRDLRVGDLLPGAALEEASSRVLVPLSVDEDRLPAGLAHGDRVDVYVSSESGGQGRVDSEPVLSAVTVQSVSGRGSGAFSGSGSAVQLTVAISPADEGRVVPLVSGGSLYVVQRLGSPN
jgi:hypothetical protein